MGSKNSKNKVVGIILVVLLLLGAAFATYWFVLRDGGSAPIAMTSEEKLAHDNLVASGVDNSLANFFIASGKQQGLGDKSHVLTMNDGGQTAMTSRVDGNGNTHTIMEGMEVISYEGKSYMKQDGVWYVFPAAAAPVAGDTTSEVFDFSSYIGTDGTIDEEDKFVSEYIGTEKLNNRDSIGYRIFEDESKKSYTDIWFDKADYRLYRMVSVAEDGSKSDMSLSYEEVVITPPADAREFGI
jgi:hypothetical protein